MRASLLSHPFPFLSCLFLSGCFVCVLPCRLLVESPYSIRVELVLGFGYSLQRCVGSVEPFLRFTKPAREVFVHLSHRLCHCRSEQGRHDRKSLHACPPFSLVRRIVPGDVIRDKVSENLSQIDEGGDSPLRRLLEPACRTASFDRKLRGPCPRCALLFIPPVVRDQSPADGGPACYPPYRPMYGRVGHRSARPVTLVNTP